MLEVELIVILAADEAVEIAGLVREIRMGDAISSVRPIAVVPGLFVGFLMIGDQV